MEIYSTNEDVKWCFFSTEKPFFMWCHIQCTCAGSLDQEVLNNNQNIWYVFSCCQEAFLFACHLLLCCYCFLPLLSKIALFKEQTKTFIFSSCFPYLSSCWGKIPSMRCLPKTNKRRQIYKKYSRTWKQEYCSPTLHYNDKHNLLYQTVNSKPPVSLTQMTGGSDHYVLDSNYSNLSTPRVSVTFLKCKCSTASADPRLIKHNTAA